MAKALVNSLAADWDPAKYTDQYRENLMRIIKGKVKGKKVDLEPANEPRQAEVVDLMERLRRSLGQGGGARAKAANAGKDAPPSDAHDARPDSQLQECELDCRLPDRESRIDNQSAIDSESTCCSPCSRRWPTRRSTIRSSSTNRSTTASARSRRSGRRRRPPVVAARQREDAPVPGDRRGAPAVGARAESSRVVLDGEIVALDAKGEPAGFQQLQGRIHLLDAAAFRDAARPKARAPSATVEREASAERPTSPSSPSTSCATARPTGAIARSSSGAQRSSDLFATQAGSPIAPHQRRWSAATAARCTSARSTSGWEGLIAKHADSLYKSGKRTPDWRKLKIVHEQEFVIGGWTEPRQTRTYFGALLLGGLRQDDRPRLRRPHRHRLQRTRARARDEAAEAARNHRRVRSASARRPTSARTGCAPSSSRRSSSRNGPPTESCGIRSISDCATTRRPSDVTRERHCRSTFVVRRSSFCDERSRLDADQNHEPTNHEPRTIRHEPPNLVDQLRALEQSRRDGDLDLPDGDRLKVTNLHKIFWPKQKLTKGDLFRYYVARRAVRSCRPSPIGRSS